MFLIGQDCPNRHYIATIAHVRLPTSTAHTNSTGCASTIPSAFRTVNIHISAYECICYFRNICRFSIQGISTVKCMTAKQNLQIANSEKQQQNVQRLTSILYDWFDEKIAASRDCFTPCPVPWQKEIVEEFENTLKDEHLPLSVCSVCGELFPQAENQSAALTSQIFKPLYNDQGVPTLDKCGINANGSASVCKKCFKSLLKG
jgi:hypothetical protein